MTNEREIAQSLFNSLVELDDGKTRADQNTNLPTSLPHLKWMCLSVKFDNFPADKANRWIGYIQGVMIACGYSTLRTESYRIRNIE
ncbi:MAG: hypothetical protein ACRC80_22240 [Waterburya sp.]